MALVVEGDDLYALLAVDKEATQDEINRAYRKAARECHPDKATGDDATQRFQKLGVAYAILRDPEKRQRYDEDGDVSNVDLPGDMGIADFVANMFHKFSFEEIDEKMLELKGSKQELEWLVADYKRFKGDFVRVLDDGYVMYDTMDPKEEDRLCALLEGLVKKGELKSTKNWKATKFTAAYKLTDAYKKRWAKKRADAKLAAKEKEELLKKNPRLGASKKEGLGRALALQGANFINQLHTKLSKKYKVEKELEIDPAAFEAAKNRLAERRAAKAGSYFEKPATAAGAKRMADKSAALAAKKKYKVEKELEIDPAAFEAARKRLADRRAATGSYFEKPATAAGAKRMAAKSAKKGRHED
eukprot:Hpha_TRINITY_DN15403_c1_g2::TRINITY_DN15403_c1_g2_i2::g.175733::m.175733/K09529/DNAJC9; DnaJ homolog subfamily C member 9